MSGYGCSSGKALRILRVIPLGLQWNGSRVWIFGGMAVVSGWPSCWIGVMALPMIKCDPNERIDEWEINAILKIPHANGFGLVRKDSTSFAAICERAYGLATAA